MQELEFLTHLFDKKLIDILRLFFQFPEKKFYLKEISDSSKVSMATTHRTLTKLVKLEVLDEIKISKFKVYQLARNEKTNFLGSFIKQSVKVAELFVEKAKDIEGVEMIILHGKETDTKANLLIIGQEVPKEEIKSVAAELKEKYNFTISYLTLTQEQYEQMSAMGLYSGSKKILHQA
ncbi:MAG: hypothetical protein ACLFPQ_00075 [Candidatus Woesearchaeota archaeon]